MKSYVLILLLLLIFLIGCKSSKPLISTNSEIKTEEHIQKDIFSSSSEKQTKQSVKSETKTVVEEEKTITTTTEYDTDKPIDPETGKPPVKSESKTETTKNKKEESKLDENITKNAESESNIIDQSKTEANQDKKESVTEESPKDPYRYRYIFYIITSIISLALVIFICWKKADIISFVKKRLGF